MLTFSTGIKLLQCIALRVDFQQLLKIEVMSQMMSSMCLDLSAFPAKHVWTDEIHKA